MRVLIVPRQAKRFEMNVKSEAMQRIMLELRETTPVCRSSHPDFKKFVNYVNRCCRLHGKGAQSYFVRILD